MPTPPPDVRKLIDEFAERLFALAGGGQIPDDWKRNLAKRLAPKPKPRPKPLGRPLNLARLEAVAYEIARRSLEHSPAVAKTSPHRGDPDKAKSVLPEEEKRRISEKYGCSVRTITNLQSIVDRVLPELSKLSDEGQPVPPRMEGEAVPGKPARFPSDEEQQGVVLSGFSRAIGERGKLKDEEENLRRKGLRRRGGS